MYAQLCTELSYALRGLVGHRFCGGRTVSVIKALIHDFFSSCLCPLLLFLLAPFPFEDSLAFQWGEWAWKCLNCSRSMFFLSFSEICRACDTLVLFSWPTVFCQQCYLWEQREHGRLSGSISEGLEEDLWAAESQGLSVPIWQTVSLWLGDFNPVAPHCSGTSVPWVCSLFWQDKGTSSQGMRFFFHRNYLKPLVGEDGEKKG